MALLKIPPQLEKVLNSKPAVAAWIQVLVSKVEPILEWKDQSFFPDYTDHGVQHISDVLEWECKLVPDEVWKNDVLTAEDAAVIIGSAVLHDIGMHLYPTGFRELVKPDTPFKPLPWFNQDKDGHRRDRPWPEIWEEYEREARRFSEEEIERLLGSKAVRGGWRYRGLPDNEGLWTPYDRLVVGEFIRRHHPRLAHEITRYGFPGLRSGLESEEFPILAEPKHMEELADLVGLVARSHGMWDLRVCRDYIESSPLHEEGLRTADCAVYYPMALLRVADYLQMQHARAPAILLNLKDPPSKVSQEEWAKHRAVKCLKPHRSDPSRLVVQVNSDVPHNTFLQLKALVAGVQWEMDHSTAILSESYETCTDKSLASLVLKYRRIDSNLNRPAFQKALPYVPEATGYSVDPQLLGQLVEPLYGNYPCVGVRELIQNAVDAVREREEWCRTQGKSPEQLGLPSMADGAEVLVEFVHHPENNSWTLEVTDRGIGMTASTLQHYFLRAGASFRRSPEWGKQFTDADGKSKVLRSGRFGIGVFAIFLLGDTFTLETRHVGAGEGEKGYRLVAGRDSKQIVIERVTSTLSAGTRIVVNLSEEAVGYLELDFPPGSQDRESCFGHLFSVTNWYLADEPRVVRRVYWSGEFDEAPDSRTIPLSIAQRTEEYAAISLKVERYQAVRWALEGEVLILCNGFVVRSPGSFVPGSHRFSWKNGSIQLNLPCIEVGDPEGVFPLTTQRYDVQGDHLPFADALERDVVLNFIAHTLVHGPRNRLEALTSWCMKSRVYPLSKKIWMVRSWRGYPWGGRFEESLDHYCSTTEGFVPNDPWLLSFMQTAIHIVSVFDWRGFRSYDWMDVFVSQSTGPLESAPEAVMEWRFLDDDAFVRGMQDNLPNKPSGLTKADEGWLFEICAKSFYRFPRAFHVRVVSGVNVNDSPKSGNRPIFNVVPKSHEAWRKEGDDWALQANLREFGQYDTSVLTSYCSEIRERLGKSATFGIAAVYIPSKDDIQPSSFLAQIWNEVLGPEIIPFDPVKRQALIEKARKHEGMKRHLEYWERRKRNEERDKVLAAREQS